MQVGAQERRAEAQVWGDTTRFPPDVNIISHFWFIDVFVKIVRRVTPVGPSNAHEAFCALTDLLFPGSSNVLRKLALFNQTVADVLEALRGRENCTIVGEGTGQLDPRWAQGSGNLVD